MTGPQNEPQKEGKNEVRPLTDEQKKALEALDAWLKEVIPH